MEINDSLLSLTFLLYKSDKERLPDNYLKNCNSERDITKIREKELTSERVMKEIKSSDISIESPIVPIKLTTRR
jgi:hypothetical protein